MENKETKKDMAEELSDEVLDEVSGGVYQLKDPTKGNQKSMAGGIQQSKSVATPPGSVTVPKKPVSSYK